MPGAKGKTGRPLHFRCAMERRGRDGDHVVVLTGKQRHYKGRGTASKAPRISEVQLQYSCSCGFTGWSAHAELAKDGRTAKGKRVRIKRP